MNYANENEARRDAIRIEAQGKNCSPYLCIPRRTLRQACSDISKTPCDHDRLHLLSRVMISNPAAAFKFRAA